MITIHSVLRFTTLLLWSSAWIYGNIYPWTDADGRTLQAEFIEVCNTLNINLNGQPFQIPMDSLSEESKALAAMLQKQKGKTKELHDWTDNSGRTIKSGICRFDFSERDIALQWEGVHLAALHV